MRRLLSIERSEPDELARLMNAAFAGYFVRFEFSGESLRARMHLDGVDPKRSKIIEIDGQTAGLALIVPRGNQCRLATMGMITEYRGKGHGRKFLQDLIEESERNGERQMVLEVIQQNAAALKLYESEGFKIVRELFGFEIEVPEGEKDCELTMIPAEELARTVAEQGDGELPWQLSADTMARIDSQGSCFRLGPSAAAIIGLDAAEPRIISLVCDRGRRREGATRRLLRALFAEHPKRRWTVPAVCPPGSAAAFLAATGFEMIELRQCEMIRNDRGQRREGAGEL